MALALCGCIGGERVKLEHDSPQPSTAAALKPIALSVAEKREVVTSREKDEWYLGEAPGSDKDLSNSQLIPLAHQIRKDLVDELAALGYDVVSEKDVRKLTIEVREWHVDAQTRTLTYRLMLAVLEHDEGPELAQSTVQGVEPITAADEKSMKADVKQAYVHVVRKLVRDNPAVLAALAR